MTDLQPVILSLEVAFVSTCLVFILGLLFAYGIVHSSFPGKAAIEACLTLPLVLPPVVTGFILLLIIGKQGFVGQFFDHVFHTQLVFTPYAAVLAGTIVAFPLMYQSTKAALKNVDPQLEDAARTLGSTEWEVFYKVTLPLAWPGIVAGTVLSFARALGEFGATIMVAGNIPGKTQTIPLAIYFASESNDLTTAGYYVIIISVITFIAIYGINAWAKTRDFR